MIYFSYIYIIITSILLIFYFIIHINERIYFQIVHYLRINKKLKPSNNTYERRPLIMKKLKNMSAFFICCILSLNMVICNVKADNNVVLSNKAYLLKTGMPQKEIEKLDDDVMQFIVDDLKSGGKHLNILIQISKIKYRYSVAKLNRYFLYCISF